MRMKINETKCRGCGTCSQVCPSQTITVMEGKARINPRYCMDCGTCMAACPNNAIYMVRPAGGQAADRLFQYQSPPEKHLTSQTDKKT